MYVPVVQLTPGLQSSCLQVRGRGELQLGILIEEMRREKCVFCVSDRLAHDHVVLQPGVLCVPSQSGLPQGRKGRGGQGCLLSLRCLTVVAVANAWRRRWSLWRS